MLQWLSYATHSNLFFNVRAYWPEHACGGPLWTFGLVHLDIIVFRDTQVNDKFEQHHSPLFLCPAFEADEYDKQASKQTNKQTNFVDYGQSNTSK